MDFTILGSIEAAQDGRPLQIGGPRQRALLARLLVDANHVVSADRLVCDLWETPPHAAQAALQNQVSRLRKLLGDRLVTKAPGYLIRVEPGELDLDRFRGLLAEAGGIANLQERSQRLREADTLFSGTPLDDVEAPFAESERAALEELRLAAVEARIDADLERERPAGLVPELAALVREHPLRERFRAQLILALYRSGRQAEALDAYRAAKRMLDEELGLEPSPQLRELEQAILTHDKSLAVVPVAAEDAPIAAAAAPRRRRSSLAVGIGVVVALLLAASSVALVLATRTTPTAKAPPIAPAPIRHQVPATVPAKPPRHKSLSVARHKTRPTHRVVRKTVHHSVTERRTAPRPAPVTVPKHVAVHTYPIRTTTAPTHPTKPRTAPVTKTTETTTPGGQGQTETFSDDFSETTPNYRLWSTGVDGTGATWALQNGALVMTIPADAQTGGKYNQVGPSWYSVCRFNGNFDERIDYRLLEWPTGGGAHVQLNAWVFPNDNSSAGRLINQYDNSYNGNVNQGWNLVNTADMQGTLRLARVGTNETAYYKSAGKWVALHTGKAPGDAMVGIQLFATSNEWQHQEVSVAFDNFSITASNFVCP